MPNNLNMGFSPAGMALGLNQLPGMGGFGFGDTTMETPEERRKRLAQLAQSQQSLTQQGSPATSALGLGGSMFGTMSSTGLLR